ncbi:hypothetical protein EV363DRAFT_727525 [Boletus edulis]|nr:hypothetical protein EV363DRAFT_727525 [Boletus edulis]
MKLDSTPDALPRPPVLTRMVHSRIEMAKDKSVPPKIAGSRRKREPIKFSSKHVIEVDDESAPPRKKNREDRLGIEEDKVKSKETLLDIIPISRAKRRTNTAKPSPPAVVPMATADSDEHEELKPACQGTRRSSRIKKRQMPVTSGTRQNVTRGKTQKGKQADARSTCDIERNLGTVALKDTGVEIGHDTPKVNCQVALLELSGARNAAPETNVPREMLKGSNILTSEPNQPSVPPGEEPRENLDSIQLAASNAMQLVQPQYHIKVEEITDDRHLMFEVRPVDKKINQVQKVVGYSVSSEKGGDPVVVVESTPRTEPVTIDLTIDESPAEEMSKLHKVSVDPACSEVDIRTKLKTPDSSDGITVEEPVFVPSPRHRRRSVTFASPIEYVLDKKAKCKAQVSSSSRRHPSPSESNTLSPFRIPTGPVNVRRESPGQITPRVTLQNSKLSQASVHDKTADEAEIQDIVEVLNEIQAVIIKGISDKFRNVKKDVQHNRDELIQQVLDELRAMAVENAKYFNGLLRLEEDYHKNCKIITRCWEELIDCNDGAVVHFQDSLKEHDQNISARTFPRSLIPLQPAFPRRRA